MSGPAEPTDVLGASELVRFASELADSPERWRNLVRLEPSVRVYETLWSDDYVNAWVICWPDDADTGFHDHDTSAAGIIVVEGSLLEERLALSGPQLRRRSARAHDPCLLSAAAPPGRLPGRWGWGARARGHPVHRRVAGADRRFARMSAGHAQGADSTVVLDGQQQPGTAG
jgi:hypothetical protein